MLIKMFKARIKFRNLNDQSKVHLIRHQRALKFLTEQNQV